MVLGPVELVVIGFPGNNFHGEIAPAIAELVETNTVRIIDCIFVIKDENGTVGSIELAELDDADLAQIDPVVDDVSGWLSEDDLRSIGDMLELNSSALLILYENVWASRLATAVRNAGGKLVLSERIPYDAIVAAEAYSAS